MCTRKYIQEFPCSIVLKVKNWKQPNVHQKENGKENVVYSTQQTKLNLRWKPMR